MVADQDVYIVNTAGNMSLIDPTTGEPALDEADPGRTARRGQRRTRSTFAATISICSSWIARRAGCWSTRARPISRAGLNLRDYDLDIVNRFNDRIYFATVVGNDRLPARDGAGSARVCSGTPRPCRSATCRRKDSRRRLRRCSGRRAGRPAEGRARLLPAPTSPAARRKATTRSRPTPPSDVTNSRLPAPSPLTSLLTGARVADRPA